MTLLVKDANSTQQALATLPSIAGELATIHVTGAVINGIATPTQETSPLPTSMPGSTAVNGSGTIADQAVAQNIFLSTVPTHGFQIGNNTGATLYVCDIGTATAGGQSMPIANGAIYTTPLGYKPAGVVSIFGGLTGMPFAARRW